MRGCAPIGVYLNWGKYDALVDWIGYRFGIEPSPQFEMPAASYQPPIKWSVCNWPARWVIEAKG